MLQEGDRLTELMVQKERLEIDHEIFLDLREADDPDFDEAAAMEVEIQLEEIVEESEMITETLDVLEEGLVFLTDKVEGIRKEIEELDVENIQAPRFKGLDSVEVARATLRTFFMVLLDINVYKRDLENKCIEQDEAIVELRTQVSVYKEMSTAGMGATEKAVAIRKQRAIG